MATERQIEANRRNAQKSTGPRSVIGRKRASRNSYKHGLSKLESGAEFDALSESLAREIAGPTNHPELLKFARIAAEAELRLKQIRQLKIAMIEKFDASFGMKDGRSMLEQNATAPFDTDCDANQARPTFSGACDKIREDGTEGDSLAIQNLSVALNGLLRYENREAAKRNKAIRKIAEISRLS